MRMFILTFAALALAGCQSTSLSGFFGTSDPCGQAELGYAAFVTVAATTDKITPTAKKAAAAGIAIVREQCSDGDISKATLAKAVSAYVAGLEAWKQ